MISRKELISSKEYWLVKFRNSLFEEVEKYLKDNNISKTEFSKKLGVRKGYVSHILSGDFDHKVSKLIELCLAIEKVPFLKLERLEKCIYLDSMGPYNATPRIKRGGRGSNLQFKFHTTEGGQIFLHNVQIL